MVRSSTDARDVAVTGMGFCLPGIGQPAITTQDVWEIASQGKTATVAWRSRRQRRSARSSATWPATC